MNKRANIVIGLVMILVGISILWGVVYSWHEIRLHDWAKTLGCIGAVFAILVGVGGVCNKLDMIKWFTDSR